MYKCNEPSIELRKLEKWIPYKVMTRYNIITNKVRTSEFLAALSNKDVPHHHMCKNGKEIVQKVWAHKEKFEYYYKHA